MQEALVAVIRYQPQGLASTGLAARLLSVIQDCSRTHGLLAKTVTPLSFTNAGKFALNPLLSLSMNWLLLHTLSYGIRKPGLVSGV